MAVLVSSSLKFMIEITQDKLSFSPHLTSPHLSSIKKE